jgi:hypothetical protein
MSYRLEGSDLGLLFIIGQLILHVVHSHATFLAFKPGVSFLGYTLVSAVPGFEVEDSSPIVGKVVSSLASGAG